MENLAYGSSLSTLFVLKSCERKRESSYARDGSNRDWIDIDSGGAATIAEISGPAVVRHIWCTLASREEYFPRRIVIRAFWDGEEEPSIEAPIGDFFGIGHGITKSFASEPLTMSPEGGRAYNCYFPMPFVKSARFEIENQGDDSIMFYYYIDYELLADSAELSSTDVGYFHAQWRREPNTAGWADVKPGVLEEKQDGASPAWLPKVVLLLTRRGKTTTSFSKQPGEESTSAAISTSIAFSEAPTTGTVRVTT